MLWPTPWTLFLPMCPPKIAKTPKARWWWEISVIQRLPVTGFRPPLKVRKSVKAHQLALNRFQTVTLELTTSEQTLYTAPTGYTAIVLYAHVTNVGTATATVTLKHIRSSTETEIIKNGIVPIADALIPMSGKLVLETSDSLKVTGSANNMLKIIVSLLETAN